MLASKGNEIDYREEKERESNWDDNSDDDNDKSIREDSLEGTKEVIITSNHSSNFITLTVELIQITFRIDLLNKVTNRHSSWLKRISIVLKKLIKKFKQKLQNSKLLNVVFIN